MSVYLGSKFKPANYDVREAPTESIEWFNTRLNERMHHLNEIYNFPTALLFVDDYFESIVNEIDLAAEQMIYESSSSSSSKMSESDEVKLNELRETFMEEIRALKSRRVAHQTELKRRAMASSESSMNEMKEKLDELGARFTHLLNEQENELPKNFNYDTLLDSYSSLLDEINELITSRKRDLINANVFFVPKLINPLGILLIIDNNCLNEDQVDFLRQKLAKPSLNDQRDIFECLDRSNRSIDLFNIYFLILNLLQYNNQMMKEEENRFALKSVFRLNEECEWIRGAVDLGYQSIGEIAANDLINLTGVKELQLWRNSLNTLAANLFSALVQCERIYLDNNVIEEIDEKAFSNLRSLKTLDLHKNRIKSIPANAFRDLASLTHLQLLMNKIERLDAKLFSSCTHLVALNLRENKIECLDDTIFESLRSLEVLDLSINCLKHVSARIFSTLVALKELSLYENQLATIDESAFANLSSLERIFLHSNQLRSLSNKWFRGLDKLINIGLNLNQIDHLTDDLFADQRQLDRLILDGNKIGRIKASDFVNHTRMRKLYLNSNEIERIHESSFNTLASLQILWLQKNKLNELNANHLANLSNLQQLVLSENYLEKIDGNLFEQCPNLLVLRLDKNRIRDIDVRAFNALPNLKVLNLDDNEIETRFDEATFRSLRKLEKLHMYKFNRKLYGSSDYKANLSFLSGLNTVTHFYFMTETKNELSEYLKYI